MKRAVLIASGMVLVVLGLLVAAAGGVAAALFGTDGSLATAPARVSGSGVALVIEDIAIDASSIPVPDGVGTLTLTVSDPGGGTMFAGSAPGEFVDTYLTGAPYDVVVEVAAGSDGSTRAVPGTQQPPPPTTQSFWTRQASGRPAELTARVSSDTTLVVMNADATPGVTADLVVTLTVARAWTYAWIAVGVGVMILIFGIIAFWRARVAGRTSRAAATSAAGPTPAAAPVVAASGATILPGADVPTAAGAAVVDPTSQAAVVPAAPTESAVLAAAAADPSGPEPAPSPGDPDPEPPTSDAAAADGSMPVEGAVEGSVPEDPTTGPVAPAEAAPDATPPDATPPDATPHAGDAEPPLPDEPVYGELVSDDPEAVGAAPVDMAALFAPTPPEDDATAVLPAVPPMAPPSAEPTAPVAPAGTEHPAG